MEVTKLDNRREIDCDCKTNNNFKMNSSCKIDSGLKIDGG